MGHGVKNKKKSIDFRSLAGDTTPDPETEARPLDEDEIRRVLKQRGWKDSAIDQMLQQVYAEVVNISDIEAAGYFNPADSGNGKFQLPYIAIDEKTGQNDQTIEHEYHHAADFGLNPGLDGTEYLSRLSKLRDREDYPYAAEQAKRILTARTSLQSSPRKDIPAISDMLQHKFDPAHVNHRLIEGLNFDYSQLPPEYHENKFNYANYGPSQESRLGDMRPGYEADYNMREPFNDKYAEEVAGQPPIGGPYPPEFETPYAWPAGQPPTDPNQFEYNDWDYGNMLDQPLPEAANYPAGIPPTQEPPEGNQELTLEQWQQLLQMIQSQQSQQSQGGA